MKQMQIQLRDTQILLIKAEFRFYLCSVLSQSIGVLLHFEMDRRQHTFLLVVIHWTTLCVHSSNITVGYSEYCSLIYRAGPAVYSALQDATNKGLVSKDTNIRWMVLIIIGTDEFVFKHIKCYHCIYKNRNPTMNFFFE